MTNAQKLYQVAYDSIGRDMSPADIAPDNLACAESLNGVFKAAFGSPIGTGPALTSTYYLYQEMLKDPRLEATTKPQAGDIVISPSGYSTKNSAHGHCGVWGNHDVMSNGGGAWQDNYTQAAWYNVFSTTLGFPVFFFHVKG